MTGQFTNSLLPSTIFTPPSFQYLNETSPLPRHNLLSQVEIVRTIQCFPSVKWRLPYTSDWRSFSLSLSLSFPLRVCVRYLRDVHAGGGGGGGKPGSGSFPLDVATSDAGGRLSLVPMKYVPAEDRLRRPQGDKVLSFHVVSAESSKARYFIERRREMGSSGSTL